MASLRCHRWEHRTQDRRWPVDPCFRAVRLDVLCRLVIKKRAALETGCTAWEQVPVQTPRSPMDPNLFPEDYERLFEALTALIFANVSEL